MDLIKFDSNNVIIKMTEDEIRGVGNSMNEVCNGLKVIDFKLKMRVFKDTASQLLSLISSIYHKIKNYNLTDIEDENNEFKIKLDKIGYDTFMIEISITALVILINAVKVVLNELEDWEFETRMGVSLEEACCILKNLTFIHQKIDSQ